MARSWYPLVTNNASCILKIYCISAPSSWKSLFNTIFMEDVLALKLHYWFLTQSLDIADRTVRFLVLTKGSWEVIYYTMFIQTCRMFCLITISKAFMAALEQLRTTLLCLIYTLSLAAVVYLLSFHRALTESTFSLAFDFPVLGTWVALMVWVQLACGAEVIWAVVAFHSVHSPVLGRFRGL